MIEKFITALGLSILVLSCSQDKTPENLGPGISTDLSKPSIFEDGIISVGEYESHPAFSPTGDTLYFIKCTVDLNMSTICVSYKKNGKWTSPEVAPFSGRYLDVDPFVTKDGNTIYFSSNRPVQQGGSIKPDWDIWKVENRNGEWGKPIHLDTPINSSQDEYYPTIADNGNLYFGSRREGGKGGSDIYFAKLTNRGYYSVENIGDSINTTNNEYEPFIASDETYLIFMATIPNGLEHGDLYISYSNNGTWSKPIKLPAPINSDATEWSPKITRDNKYLFFGSTRNKNIGQVSNKENIVSLQKRLNATGNGLGDIYYINSSAVFRK